MAAVTALKIVYQRAPKTMTPMMAATAMRLTMPRDEDLAGTGCSLMATAPTVRTPIIAPNLAKAVFRSA
jgi:predicted secreted Zn-dependent protease